jgi:hypothetical protein
VATYFVRVGLDGLGSVSAFLRLRRRTSSPGHGVAAVTFLLAVVLESEDSDISNSDMVYLCRFDEEGLRHLCNPMDRAALHAEDGLGHKAR